MKTKETDWKSRWEKFIAEMGSGPSFGKGKLPKNVRVCRDFRVAVPMICGTPTSSRFADIPPVEAELTLEELLSKEKDLVEMGMDWRGAIFETVNGYGEILCELNIDIPDPYFGVGEEVVENWMPWMREHQLFVAADQIETIVQIVWLHRAIGEGRKKLGGVFDSIICAGGLPCGTESSEPCLYSEDYCPSSLVAFWPRSQEPKS